MITLPGYHIRQKVYESDTAYVCRGRRKDDNLRVILKLLKQTYPTPGRIARFKHEYDIMHDLHLVAGVVDAYSLESEQNQWILVQEDFGGDSLSHLGLVGRLTLKEFLKLAIQIADILGQIHQHHIIHKDINPSNILFNPGTEQAKITDFGISALVSTENPTARKTNMLEGTLAYMSPEQTGRLDRALDYRTDLYSLGVTYYELLTGQLPFPTTDMLELVHSHIARQPPSVSTHRSEIPTILSDIVQKLMAKNAEDRYQSAYGLRADLEECLRQWQSIGQINPFPLGQYDNGSGGFQIPHRLYGRSHEMMTLLSIFERVSQGASEIAMVSGYVGIGKTALVHQLHRPIISRGGYFTSGKFDQFQRNIPYSAIIQALRSLVRHLLTKSETEIATWRERLLTALGPNGQVIIEVIPEVKLIIDEQPDVPAIGPTEAQNRFNLVFQQFMRVFAQQENPLVIFLDDLQWADRVSLKFLERLMTASDSSHFMVIGAYRENEVDEQHPLHWSLDRIDRSGTRMHHLSIQPLDVPVVTQMVAEILPCALEQARPLADLVVTKTGGNPFFLNEFLKSLYNEGLLAFDYVEKHWSWNLERIQAHEMTDNMIELMTHKVQRFSEQTQKVLKMAACISNQFDLVTLAVVAERTTGEIIEDLEHAVQEGLIVPLTHSYTLIVINTNGREHEVLAEYTFAHDRIQQAIYSMLPEQDRKMAHWKVGQVLLWSMPPTEREDYIFDIVYQLNQCRMFMASQDERDELVALNLLAGKRAKSSAAYEASFSYLWIGIELLGGLASIGKTHPQDESAAPDTPPATRDDHEHWTTNPWRRQYKLTLELFEEAAEAAYLIGRFEQMDDLIITALEHARSTLDKVKVYEVKILAYVAQNHPLEAVKTGLQILELLEVTFVEKPGKTEQLPGMEETLALLEGKTIADLQNLPHITDPSMLAARRILLSITNAAYNTITDLFLLFVFKQVNMSVTHGNAPVSAFAYASYGRILCSMLGDIHIGYQFGQLALHLLSQFNAKEFKARTYVVVYHFITPWKEHIRETISHLMEAYQSGLETGDLEFATLAAQGYCYHSFFAGRELSELDREIAAYRETLTQLNQAAFLDIHRICHQAVLNLVENREHPSCLSGVAYDEEQMVSLHRAAKEHMTLYFFHLNKLILCYLFGEYAQAVEHADNAMTYEHGVTGLFIIPVCLFYDSLARLALLRSDETYTEPGGCNHEQTAEQHLEQVTANQERLQRWSEYAPMNHLHKWYLVEAEKADMMGNDGDAWQYYHQAITLVREHGYLNEEALALELAARFYRSKAMPQFVRTCLQDAYYAYLRWGAITKTIRLEAQYPEFLAETLPRQSRQRITNSIDHTVHHASSTLDLSSVVRASQTISDDIVLDTLLSKLLKIVIENAGANRGVLILQRQGQWAIEAEGAIDREHVAVLQSIPVNAFPDNPLLPLSVTNYVANTRECVVLHDAVHDGQFTSDRYITRNRSKSILCMPLMNQGKLTGMLYLENNLTTGVFTPDRLEVLNLLSAQAAISIEKARLYTNLEAALAQQVALTRAYSRFVPREILQFLGKDSITQVKLGDQIQQEMTILFSDIRNFTSLSEQMSPQQNFNFINSYLSRVSPIIREYNGFIDKYIGDAIMALFPGQPDDAIQAAIGMQQEVILYNTHRARYGYRPISIGIGLHTGSVMLGTVGEVERMEGTVISDGVNLASRLEGLTKVYGASIVVSEETLLRVSHPDQYQFRLLGTVKVKGKQEAIAMCEILDGYPQELMSIKLQTRNDFEEGLMHYRNQDFQQAIECFKSTLVHDPEDKAALLYLQRATRFMEYGVTLEWDTLEALTEKA